MPISAIVKNSAKNWRNIKNKMREEFFCQKLFHPFGYAGNYCKLEIKKKLRKKLTDQTSNKSR